MASLQIKIIRAQNLTRTDEGGRGKIDPYVLVKLANQSYQTRALQNELNPVYNEVFTFTDRPQRDFLHFELYDDDGNGTAKFIGKNSVGSDEIPSGIALIPLTDVTTGKACGQVEVEITHIAPVPQPTQVVVIQSKPQRPQQPQTVIVQQQQPTVVVQQPGRQQQQPTIIIQQQQPTVVVQQPGRQQQQPTVVVQQPGRQQQQPTVVVQQNQPGKTQPGGGGRNQGNQGNQGGQSNQVVTVSESQQRWQAFIPQVTLPANYTGTSAALLTQLDGMGAVNLARINRDTLTSLPINYILALFLCPYEGQQQTMGLQPLNDGIALATLYISRGYHVVYLCDGTPKEYYTWTDWLLSNVHYELTSYFCGLGSQLGCFTGKEKDNMSEVYMFFPDSKKKVNNQGAKVKNMAGITDMSVSDEVIRTLIVGKQYPDTRLVFISECSHSGTMINLDQAATGNQASIRLVHIGACKDEQTAKQALVGGQPKGLFTHNFITYFTTNKTSTFKDLEEYTKKNIASSQDIVLTASQTALLTQPVITNGQ